MNIRILMLALCAAAASQMAVAETIVVNDQVKVRGVRLPYLKFNRQPSQ